MAIKPFVDKPQTDIGNFQQAISSSAGMDTTAFDLHRQGINVRGMQDYRLKLSPYISDMGFPNGSMERFNPSVEQNHWGQPKLFEDPSPVAKPGVVHGPGPAPFDDIVGRWNPVNYISDSGNQQYPMVLLSPNWLDPAQMDSIIEPLAIRHKMSNTMTEGPHEAHQIRGSLQPMSGPELLGMGIEISRFVEFEPRATIPPYYDAQNEAIHEKITTSKDADGFTKTTTPFSISTEGYAFPVPKQISPFDDAVKVNNTTINFSIFEISSSFDDLGSFIDDPRLGILGKSACVGFIYSNENSTASPYTRHSGNKRVNGVNSIAFGGFLK